MSIKKLIRGKKLEFIAKEIKEFFNDFDNKRAFLLLDWNRIDIPIQEGEIKNNPKKIIIDDNILFTSLIHHSQKQNDGFTEEETLVRKVFDHFLFKLGIFNQFINTGLITEKDLKPYLIYWLELIGKLDNGRKSNTLILQIWKYINLYENTDVINLFKRYDFDITNYDK